MQKGLAAIIIVLLFAMCSTPQQFATNTQTAEHPYAFVGNYGQDEYTIPDGITFIAQGAFAKCFHLKAVVIPTSVTRIEKWAFFNCHRLQQIYYTGTLEQWQAISKDKSWCSGVKNCIVHCADGATEYVNK